jgi:hypothetical protein
LVLCTFSIMMKASFQGSALGVLNLFGNNRDVGLLCTCTLLDSRSLHGSGGLRHQAVTLGDKAL